MQLQAMAKLAASYVNTTNRHIFLTGKAGTGKTTFLKYIIQNTHKHCVVAAPTGIAAINAGGVTLHSLLQLPFGTFVPENIRIDVSENRINSPQTLFRNFRFNESKRQLIREIELLIIDEVSMLRADLLDCIDFTLRRLRRNSSPFGGLQILFIGDLMQLPPVVKEDERKLLSAYYSSLYFFEARALKQSPPLHLELRKIFRQQDQDFIDILNRMRHNEQTNEDLNFLNDFYNPDFEQTDTSGYIHLTTHNYRADKLNEMKLAELDTELHTFPANIEDNFPESMYPCAETLSLKEGAQVMFIKNDPSGEGRFFNGKIAVVSSLSDEEIWVEFEDGDEVQVIPYRWENIRYKLSKDNDEIEEETLGSFEQYPIKLAWAVTIHKSQGLTFDKAILDLSGTFAPGQLYVALSRLRSLDGLVLSSPLPINLPKIDASLSKFNAGTKEEKELEAELESSQKAFISELGQNAFDFSGLIKSLNAHQSSFNKDENRSIKQKYSDWTKENAEAIFPLQKTGEAFIREVKAILTEEDYHNRLSERIEKAKSYFLGILANTTEKFSTHRRSLKKEKSVKAYLKELEEIEDELIRKVREIERLAFLVASLQNDSKSLTKFDTSISQQLAENKNKKPAKKDKTPTAEISFKLFQEGKSVKEIATERGLVESTVEGHLAQYIENGVLSIEELVEEKKVKKILDALNSDAVGLSEIKSALPANISYGEIKMVIAYQKANGEI